MKRLLKGGRVVDPANGIDGVRDVLIDGDRIVRVGADLPVDGATIVKLKGKSYRVHRGPEKPSTK